MVLFKTMEEKLNLYDQNVVITSKRNVEISILVFHSLPKGSKYDIRNFLKEQKILIYIGYMDYLLEQIAYMWTKTKLSSLIQKCNKEVFFTRFTCTARALEYLSRFIIVSCNLNRHYADTTALMANSEDKVKELLEKQVKESTRNK